MWAFLDVSHGEVAGTKITRNIQVVDRVTRYKPFAGVWVIDIFCQDQETDRKVNEEQKSDQEVGFGLGIAFGPRHCFRSHARSYYPLFRKSSNGDTLGNPLD